MTQRTSERRRSKSSCTTVFARWFSSLFTSSAARPLSTRTTWMTLRADAQDHDAQNELFLGHSLERARGSIGSCTRRSEEWGEILVWRGRQYACATECGSNAHNPPLTIACPVLSAVCSRHPRHPPAKDVLAALMSFAGRHAPGQVQRVECTLLESSPQSFSSSSCMLSIFLARACPWLRVSALEQSSAGGVSVSKDPGSQVVLERPKVGAQPLRG